MTGSQNKTQQGVNSTVNQQLERDRHSLPLGAIPRTETTHRPTEPTYRAIFNTSRLVVVFDPDRDAAHSVAGVFRADGFKTHAVADREAFLAFMDDNVVDILVVNIDDAEEMITKVRAETRGMIIFGITGQPDVERAVLAMKDGAMDVFTKPVKTERMLQAARNILRKDYRVTFSSDGVPTVEILGFASLSRRERDVLQFIANGNTNEETAEVLGISQRTVETHRYRLMEKLGARNAADLLRILLIQHGR